MGRRDKGPKEKTSLARTELVATIGTLLQSIQDALYQRALAYREQHTRKIDSKDDFYAFFADPPRKHANDPTPIHAGFALAHFNGDPAVEAKIKEDLKVTVRCIPLTGGEPGTCPFTGQPSKQRVVWAKSY
jgi:prolyl-tRNA synthetase